MTAALGLQATTTVASWKARGRIPDEYWIAIVGLARERQQSWVTLELLAKMAAERAKLRVA